MTTETLPGESTAPDIDWYADGETVSVLGQNQTRFEIQKDYAIEVLRVAAEHRSRFDKQFQMLLDILGDWVAKRGDNVRSAHLTVRDAVLEFVVVSDREELDEALQDSLSDLDRAIARDRSLGELTVSSLLLPPVDDVALKSFIDERLFLSYRAG